MDQNARLLQSECTCNQFCFFVTGFFTFCLLLLSSCWSCWKGVSVAIHELFCFFLGISLNDVHVVQTVSFIHSFTELQSVFSDRTTNLPAHSWRSQIVPDHLYLDVTELIQALLPNKYDKSCRSFHDGVGPCNQRFGNRNVCHGLSFDLSFVLSSICHSRDLILEIHP